MSAPFSNCRFRECDLPGQCRDEGKCHHPAVAAANVAEPVVWFGSNNYCTTNREIAERFNLTPAYAAPVADSAEKSPAPEGSEADDADSARERKLSTPSRVGDQMKIANGADSAMAKDAEAFRLMAKHRLLVGVHLDESWAQSYGTPEGKWLTIKEPNGDDACAAARRAIDRAGAAIAASAENGGNSNG